MSANDWSRPTIGYRGHYWIDPAALGTLAHLIPGAIPDDVATDPWRKGQALCGLFVRGNVVSTIDPLRACPRCCDLALEHPR